MRHLLYMYKFGLGSHFPIKLEMIHVGEIGAFDMFTFGHTVYVGPFCCLFFFGRS